MAKITPKGKNVTGTKKKDKITWVSKKPWKKALIVKAGAGNDVINFKKSKYKNTIYGEAGKDTIYGGKKNDKIYGGKGNDKIYTGKGKNTLYFSKGDGTDTILNGKGTDTLVFKTEKNINNIKVAYSGNDAIITYTKGKVILKDYKKGGHSAKYLQVGSTKKAIADYFKPAPAPVPTPTSTPSPLEDGYYVINGTNGNDSLVAKAGYNCKIIGGAGNDIIYGGDGDDNIDGGYGNDSIYAGTGSNIINGGEGGDYIDVTNGTNTIVFENLSRSIASSNVDTVYGFKSTDILQITTRYNDGMAPMIIDSNTKDLHLGVRYTGETYIIIKDYSNETRDGWIAVDGEDAIRISEFLANNHVNMYTDNADSLADLGYGKHYTFDGNDTITNVGSNIGMDSISVVYAGAGNDSITGVYGTNTEIYGEDGNDYIETSTEAMYYGSMHGGNGNDTIIAQDAITRQTLHGDDGDDVLVGGQLMIGGTGNDTITANRVNTDSSTNATEIRGEEGNDEIHVADSHDHPVVFTFFQYQNEGNDILYDNLVSDRWLRFLDQNGWEKGNDFFNSMKYIRYGNDLIIKYQDQGSDEYRNSITIKDFVTSSNQENLKFYLGYEDYVPVLNYITNNGYDEEIDTVANYTVNDSRYDSTNPLVLSQIENNNVIFSDTFTECYITSNNTSGYTDTLQISDIDISTYYNLDNIEFSAGSLHLDTWWQDDTETKGGDIYYSYSTEDTPNIVVTDSQHSYKFTGYSGDTYGNTEDPLVLGDGNNMLFITAGADKGTSYVTSNDDNNIIYTSGGAALNYTYGGGNDVVYSSDNSSDTYNVTISRENSLRINDYSGLSDAINIITENPDDLRIFVPTDGLSWEYGNIIIVNKDDFTVENLINFVEGNNHVGLGVSTSVSGIETYKINDTAINKTYWYDSVGLTVSAWLDEHTPYTSTTDAIAAYKQNPNSIDISGLVGAYTSVKFSDVYATT